MVLIELRWHVRENMSKMFFFGLWNSFLQLLCGSLTYLYSEQLSFYVKLGTSNLFFVKLRKTRYCGSVRGLSKFLY